MGVAQTSVWVQGRSLKTNAVRLLEKQGVRYETRAYEVDESALSWETISVSAGVRGLQMILSPADLSHGSVRTPAKPGNHYPARMRRL